MFSNFEVWFDAFMVLFCLLCLVVLSVSSDYNVHCCFCSPMLNFTMCFLKLCCFFKTFMNWEFKSTRVWKHVNKINFHLYINAT